MLQWRLRAAGGGVWISHSEYGDVCSKWGLLNELYTV